MTRQILESEIYEFARDVQAALLGARIPFTSQGRDGDNYSVFVNERDIRAAVDIVEKVAFDWAGRAG